MPPTVPLIVGGRDEAGREEVIRSMGGVGKTTVALVRYADAYTGPTSVRSLRRDISELDQLHSDLDRDYDAIIVPTARPARYPTAVTPPTTSLALFANIADRLLPFAVSPQFSGRLVPLDPAQRIPRDWGESILFPPDWHPDPYAPTASVFVLAIGEVRQGLLRLINGIRAILRLMLIRVLSALSRCPDAINAVLLLLAASRCFGYRTEPGDCVPPVLTSKSVVIGEAARLW
jgi:hypothetical protein